MDASNPVVDHTKKKVKDIISDAVTRRKQDLRYLTTIVSGAPRVYLDSLSARGVGDRVLESELQAFEAKVPHVDQGCLDHELLKEFLEELQPVPVSGLCLEGRPIHMPGVHQSKGFTTTARTFGGSQVDREFVRRVLEYRPVDEILEQVTAVYTHGTALGFTKRLKTLTSRSVPQTSKALGLSRPKMLLQFAKLLPVDLDVLKARSVNWHNDLAEQLDELRVSAKSGAGPPYWVSKPEALKPMLESVLPVLHKAISEGTVPNLMREQPELFLGEVKNKLDRYSIEKLASKTRPYFSLPFHLQALFSMMSQPFTDSLCLFHEGRGVNAYGFSWAHGGGQKMIEWARGCEDIEHKGKPRFCVYGDDVDIYYRSRGKLYRISPDFEQMDGSVDADIIHASVDYVYEVLSLVWGENPFFRAVADLWKHYATDPSFLIHGERVYKKKQKDGLMTGVVGTTFFDTAKSAFAYSDWVDQIQYGRRELLQLDPAREFFRTKFGLVIKDGTWLPTEVQEEPVHGLLVNENKFLGMQMIYRGGPDRVEPVPYLPEDEWTNLIMTPRDDPKNFRRGRPLDSQLTVSRRWYDRARGYMVTGAFSNPLIRKWIHGFVNSLDPVSIVMSVQEGGGKGASPDSAFLPAFTYPDSSGFPTERWCENLYFSDDNQWEGEHWEHLFPTVEDRLASFRACHRPMEPKMEVREVASSHPELKGVVHAAQQFLSWENDPSFVNYDEEVLPMAPISGPPLVITPIRVNPRSKILNYSRGELKGEMKRLPNQREVFMEFFKTRSAPEPAPRNEIGRMASALWLDLEDLSEQVGFSVYSTPVLAVRKLAANTGLSPERVEDLARECGLYVLGRRERFVTKIRLITGDPVLQKQQAKQEAQNKSESRVISEKTSSVLRVLKHSEPAEPLTVVVTRNLQAKPPPLHMASRWRGSSSVATSLNELFQSNQLVLKLSSRNLVRKGFPQVVETQLSWRPAKENIQPVWFMRVQGSSTKANLRDLYDAVISFFGLHQTRVESHSGWAIDPVSAPKERLSWADEVLSEERARVTDERGRLFSIRGPFLYPERTNIGPWLAIDQGKAVIENVRWKQRRSETLTAFLRRTVTRLKKLGLDVSAKTPQSRPIDLSPKPKKN